MIKLPSEHSSWWKCVEDVLKTCWRRLQHNSFSSSKTSWRRFQHALAKEKMLHFLMTKIENRLGMWFTVRNVSKYRVFPGPYFSVQENTYQHKLPIFTQWLCLCYDLHHHHSNSKKLHIYLHDALHKKRSFPIISSLNITKSAGKCVFGNIY